jgi:hypothetical protein
MVTPALPTDPSLQDVPRGMLAAAVLLIGLESLIGLAGLATVVAALATACCAGTAGLIWLPQTLPGSSGSRPRRSPRPAVEPGGRPNWPSTPHAAPPRRADNRALPRSETSSERRHLQSWIHRWNGDLQVFTRPVAARRGRSLCRVFCLLAEVTSPAHQRHQRGTIMELTWAGRERHGPATSTPLADLLDGTAAGRGVHPDVADEGVKCHYCPSDRARHHRGEAPPSRLAEALDHAARGYGREQTRTPLGAHLRSASLGFGAMIVGLDDPGREYS